MRTATQTHALLFFEKSYGALHYATWVLRALCRERNISSLGEIRGAAAVAWRGEIERSGTQKTTQTPPPLFVV